MTRRHLSSVSAVRRSCRDAQPGGQPDAPVRDFSPAGVSSARRLPFTLGSIRSGSTRRIRKAHPVRMRVRDGSLAGGRHGGSLCNFKWLLRRCCMGRVRIGLWNVGNALRRSLLAFPVRIHQSLVVVGCVEPSPSPSAFTHMLPNIAFERMRRQMASFSAGISSAHRST